MIPGDEQGEERERAGFLEVDHPGELPGPRPAAEPFPIEVVYEDDDLLVVDKPAGVVAHPTYKQTSGTVLNRVLWHSIKGADAPYPAPVRRVLASRLGLLRFPNGDHD